MHVFPAIDLRRDARGRCRCVRLEQGKAHAETAFSDDPPAVARRWRQAGARWLHVVDLDGAFAGRPRNEGTTAEIVRAVNARVQVGGGIRDDRDAAHVLDEVGAARVIISTRGLTDPEWLSALCERYPGRVVGGVDARGGRVAVEGWTREAGLPALEAAQLFARCGVVAVVYTDIASDGTLAGPNVEGTRELAEAIEVPVIASGGVGSLEDVRRLAELPLEGIVIGRALYTGAVDLAEAIKLSLKAGAP